jgi:hypothetical protein
LWSKWFTLQPLSVFSGIEQFLANGIKCCMSRVIRIAL